MIDHLDNQKATLSDIAQDIERGISPLGEKDIYASSGMLDDKFTEVNDIPYAPIEKIVVRKYRLYKTQGVVKNDSRIKSDETTS